MNSRPRSFISGPAVVVERAALLAVALLLRRCQSEWEAIISSLAVPGDLSAATLQAAIEDAAAQVAASADIRSGLPKPESRERPTAEAVGPSTAWIDSTAAADILGLGDRRIRQLCKNGELTAQKSAGRWLIDPASLKQKRIQ